MPIELEANTGCVTAEQNKIDAPTLFVGASNREGILSLYLALSRRCENIRRILRCR